jgi:hypothetical protein
VRVTPRPADVDRIVSAKRRHGRGLRRDQGRAENDGLQAG